MKVIKLGGELVGERSNEMLFAEIANVAKLEPVVLIHGGGDEVTYIAERLGVRQKFVTSSSGIESRYTDEETIKVYSMVMSGLISKRIALKLLKQGLRPFCITGIDGLCVMAERKKRLLIKEGDRKFFIEGGFTGVIKNVDVKVFNMLIEGGFIPIVSPVAIGIEGEMLNVDSDRMASAIASAMKGDHLIFLTNVDGVYVDGKLIEELDANEIEKIMERIGQGMKMKLLASMQALRNGTKKVIIANGFAEDLNLSNLEYMSKKTIL